MIFSNDNQNWTLSSIRYRGTNFKIETENLPKLGEVSEMNYEPGYQNRTTNSKLIVYNRVRKVGSCHMRKIIEKQSKLTKKYDYAHNSSCWDRANSIYKYIDKLNKDFEDEGFHYELKTSSQGAAKKPLSKEEIELELQRLASL